MTTTLAFVKSRNATKGAQTIVQANDNLGMIRFLGSDGTDTQNAAARIRAFCDTTPASNKIPGRIVFETTSTLTYAQERMRIDSAGRVVIGGEQGNAGASGLYVGGAALAVLGTGYTPNTYACFAMGRIGANVTNNTTIANIRLNGGTLGTGRGAEINAAADANWSDGSSHPTRLTFHTVASSSTSATERLRIDSTGRMLVSGTLGYGNMPFGGNPANAAIQIRCNSKYNGIAFGENAVSGAIGMGGADTTAAMVFVANAHPANLGGGIKDIFEWWSGTAGGGGPGKYMTLDTGGHLALTSGNLEFASGSGIDFSANSDGGRSIDTDGNKFDEYEEGTWTPTDVSGSSISFTINNPAKYTKIGRLVHCTFDITWAGGHSSGGNAAISSPFAMGEEYGSGSVGWNQVNKPLQTHVNSGGIQIMENYSNGSGGRHLSNNSASGNRIIGDATYFTGT